MFVPCPHCGFLVALIAAQDDALQRCPRCDGSVQALADEESPLAPQSPATQSIAEGSADDIGASADTESTVAAPTAEEAPSNSDPGEVTSADATAPTFEQAVAAASVGTAAPRRSRRGARPRPRGAPSFASARAATPTPRRQWRWHAALAGLVLLLALQLVLAQRQELAADARWRPFVASLCGIVQCQLEPWREPAAFTMLQRNVRAKPGSTGVLTVEASFRNDARWPQPWPTVLLSLSDVDGRLVGQRAFTPGEYRSGHRAADALLPGQSTSVTLEVIEPAPRIVAFTFDFR